MEKTKLLVIVITTAAIITAATTTSLSAATPAFARQNCNEAVSVCSGGSGWQGGNTGIIVPGGGGGHLVVGQDGSSINQGGSGFNGFLGDQVGGGGGRESCDGFGECTQVRLRSTHKITQFF